MSYWTTLDDIAPQDLVSARLELHHAAQFLGIAIGRSLLPHQDDDSHTALTWADDSWQSGEIPGSGGVRGSLRPADLTLSLAGESFGLMGKTRQEGLDWLRQRLDAAGLDGSKAQLDFHYEMPSHPVQDGAPFSADLEGGFRQLSHWYDGAAALLDEVHAHYPDASPLLTWPHHFDIGLAIALGKDADDKDRTIGVGLSPGDGSFAEPYVYVTPWPVPDNDPPQLPRGFWNRRGFFGAILTGSELAGEKGNSEEQGREFLHAAIGYGYGALGVALP